MRTKMFWSLPLFMSLALACGKKTSGNSNPIGGGDNSNPPPVVVPPKSDVELWLTQSDKTVLFKKQNTSLIFSTTSNSYTNIDVDETQTYQQIDGFGYCLTGGSASLLNSLTSTTKDNVLKELFASDSTFIGVSYLRISIGASDLSANTFTYDDMPSGQTDLALDHFSIDAEKTDLIPILKKIIAINPNIKILGSPWSPPVWMKSNNSFKGGSLKPEYYGAYAQYFVKYIQAMKAQGITIDAITVQNEPLNGNNNPSLVMQSAEQTNFVKNNLGPAFQAAGLTTKIIVWDHNADVATYPLAILGDADAKKYVDGSAFHLYSGSITALSQVHDAYPDKSVYFTEQWVGGPGNFSGDLQWHVQNLIIGATRNWSRNVLEWNLASDPSYNPHTNGGCNTCQGALTISGDAVARNVSYYIIAHASKFARPGSVRISSAQTTNLSTVAFKNPDGKKVLIVLNKGAAQEMFNIKVGTKIVTTALSSGAVGTYVW
ncbi:glycoside hydrolase family 30 protein [Pinibacter soli]|uniref:Glycoside hydrolase family 30 beta sandwich domain-containing protein n=1 Tax=Pinibacter soli TaxID=3044211 RepID=A0ABT6R8V1_9BACT|nr:glycoside hydrolase family 30 beta sandwich domain-containing protein [Pinibacter soli]MDI3318314.1 glycoside hydrolase family 30 beta sandwich domain-containing protein [Pinibacter soli]